MRFSAPSLASSARPASRLGATLALSVLALTGCGLGASGSPSADRSTARPEPSSSSSAPSGEAGFSTTTGSPSASAGATASSSASATAASSEALSTQNRVPAIGLKYDGSFDDYVPATEEAPAQKVPRPIEPEGMNEHTQEGFVKFFEYYLAERNYAITSGDTARWRELVTPAGKPNPSQQAELDFLDKVDAAYKNGGWVVRGHRKAVTDFYLVGKGNEFGEYVLNTYLVENGTVLLNPEANPPRTEWVPVTEDPYFFGLAADYEDGAWVLTLQAMDYSDTMAVPADK
ncbi:DUF6318 family protein [Rothia sp. P5764]|uniref:DUF6318 family protein n=1 Tax=Rothia sp. P5764 TaxID=3402654 RepID=UPI003ACB6E52